METDERGRHEHERSSQHARKTHAFRNLRIITPVTVLFLSTAYSPSTHVACVGLLPRVLLSGSRAMYISSGRLARFGSFLRPIRRYWALFILGNGRRQAPSPNCPDECLANLRISRDSGKMVEKAGDTTSTKPTRPNNQPKPIRYSPPNSPTPVQDLCVVIVILHQKICREVSFHPFLDPYRVVLLSRSISSRTPPAISGQTFLSPPILFP